MVILTLVELIMISPELLLLAFFYGLFYLFFYFTDLDGGPIVTIGVFLFMMLHSLAFFYPYVGIVPHILTSTSIFISARLFYRFVFKDFDESRLKKVKK